MKRKIEEIVQEKADMSRLQRCKDPMKMLQTEVTQIWDNCGEFLWCIKNWEDQKERLRNGIDKSIYSAPFYSHRNGYKMRLLVEFNFSLFGSRFSLYLQILRGEFDNILLWPFRHEVKFDLMNQETVRPHLSWTLKAAENPDDDGWKKPTIEKNKAIYFNWFFLSHVSGNTPVTKDNQICIKAEPKLNP